MVPSPRDDSFDSDNDNNYEKRDNFLDDLLGLG
jgi:hypothetical protein